ncbi:hypothetical protein ACM46_14270 [Chryseobacterium angstadtii]|uniref:Lipocalin-like domain-containing protein n=1 Tax=Chryseobacterium angstadtii TaxID=558151 RepID=A0A0J7IB69_9FLAO|nr:lipocalin family protein [Chryseobacterium angstadtii]KMQ63101.1 hypothetical protein ACM46_14270 [Chryseobacterium angstadtii]
MKKLKLTAYLSVIILVISCRNNDQADSPLLGTWKAAKTMTVSGNNGVILLQNSLTGCESNTTYQFWSNGDFEYNQYCSSPSVRETGTFSYGESTKVITFYITSGGGNQQGSETLYALTESEMQIITGKTDYDNDGVLDTSIIIYIRQ